MPEIKGEIFKNIYPKEYFTSFLQNNIRSDGRNDFNTYRNMKINYSILNTTAGSCIAKIGNTSIICGLSLQLCNHEAFLSKSNEFSINIDVYFTPICHNKFQYEKNDQHTLKEIQLASKLKNIIQKLKILDDDALTIEYGKYKWLIQADLYCLNYDGNADDCCFLALIGSLKDLIIPNTKLVENENTGQQEIKIDTTNIKNGGQKLKWKYIPLSFTIGIKFIDNKQNKMNISSSNDNPNDDDENENKMKIIYLIDPNNDEETIVDGIINIVLDANNQDTILAINKSTTVNNQLHFKHIKRCIKFAQKSFKQMRQLIQ